MALLPQEEVSANWLSCQSLSSFAHWQLVGTRIGQITSPQCVSMTCWLSHFIALHWRKAFWPPDTWDRELHHMVSVHNNYWSQKTQKKPPAEHHQAKCLEDLSFIMYTSDLSMKISSGIYGSSQVSFCHLSLICYERTEIFPPFKMSPKSMNISVFEDKVVWTTHFGTWQVIDRKSVNVLSLISSSEKNCITWNSNSLQSVSLRKKFHAWTRQSFQQELCYETQDSCSVISTATWWWDTADNVLSLQPELCNETQKIMLHKLQ